MYIMESDDPSVYLQHKYIILVLYSSSALSAVLCATCSFVMQLSLCAANWD